MNDNETMASPIDIPQMPFRNNTISTTLTAPFKFKIGKMTSLSPADHAYVCHAIGAFSGDEANTPVHPVSIIFPPRGLPDGLYKDVIRSRVISAYQFYSCVLFFNFSLFLQLALGAAITALASSTTKDNTGVTILAAANTINAGIVALMHNSGIPDRFKNDWTEYEKVELFMKEVIGGGIVRQDITREDIVADCYARYSKARETISKNKPSSYQATSLDPPGSQTKKSHL